MFRHARFLLELLAVQFFFLTSAHAAPTTIDFESHFRGEIVREQYLSRGVRISAVNWSHGPDYAVVFDSLNIGDSSDEDLEAPFDPAPGYEELGELWPGRVLILHERHDCESGLCLTPDDEGSRPAGWIEFEFAVPTTLHGMTVIDINYEDGETPAQLVLYDDDNAVIDSLDVPEVGGQGHWRPWEINKAGVSRARLYLPGDAAIDDFSFTPESGINWTPEFVSYPPVAVMPGETYHYRPDVHDPDGDVIQLELLESPPGMTLTGGELEWTAAEEGTFDVVVRASDGSGTSAMQDFTIHVTEEFIRIQDFEFATGTILDDELLADGLHVKAKNFSSGSDYVVVFDTDNPTGGDTDLGAPFDEGVNNDLELGPASPGKVLILHEEHDCDVLDRICQEPDDETTRPAGWFEFRFTQPAHVYSLDVFDIRGSDPADRTVEFYDSNDEPIPVSLSMPRTGANRWDRFDIDVPGVRRMRLNLDGDGGFDRLHYALLGEGEPDNLEPRANPDAYSVEQDETLVVDAPGVLENDSDPDEDELTAETETSPAHGILLLNLDGSFTYTPDPGYSGPDQFTYAADDGELSASAVVDIDVIESLQVIIDHFDVSPSTINPGEAATLSWVVQNADQVHIEPGLADLPASGSVSVSPDVTTTYTLTASGQGGESVAASLTLAVDESEPEPEPDPDGPLIAFYWPEEGDGVSWLTPPLALEVVQQTVMGVNPESTQIFMDGEPFPIDCGYDGNRFVVCHPLTELTVGNHSATARIADYVGNYSNTVTRNFYVDITPPPPPDAGKISVSAPDQEGESLVTGMPGAAEPGNTLQLWSGSAIRNDVPIQPDGSFAVSIDASIGEEIRIRTEDHAGNFSEDVFLPVYSAAPEVGIVAPANNALINSVQPSIDIDYLETGSGLDFSTLEVTVNGQPAAVDCMHDVSQSQCIPIEPLVEGENVISVRITDSRGEVSEAASVSITVDTIPPAGLDREKISVEQVSEGTTTVTGEAGATEPLARIVMTRGDLETEIDTGIFGEFSMIIDAGTGDEIHMTTVDGAGNHSDAEIFIVQPIPIQVEILEPYDGQQVTGNRVAIHGTHDGEYGTGVTVNGRVAAVAADGSFFVEINLEAGLSEITATATPESDETAAHTITVTVLDAPPSPISIRAYEPQGVAPHDTRFELTHDGDIDAIQAIEIDYDGDGAIDHVTANPFEELSYEFDSPGIYHPVVTLYSDAGAFAESTTVIAEDVGTLDTYLRQRFSEFTQGLQEGDKQRAMEVLSPGAQERFGPMFDVILPVIQQNLSSWQPPQLITINGRYAEYLVLRDKDGTQYGYPVTFQRMPDGTWKLTNL